MQELRSVVLEADGFSFAQLRESYIMAGQLAFGSQSSDRDGARAPKGSTLFGRQSDGSKMYADGSKVGFENAGTCE